MQVCSNFKRFRASLQELLGIKRRNRVKGQDISAPYDFKKETTVIPGITEEYLESLRDEALASQHSPTSTRSRRGVDRNKHTNKSNLKTKSHTQLRTSSSLANFTAVGSTSPPSSSSNKRQLGTSKSCLSLNALQSLNQDNKGLQPPPRKFSVPSSASSPSVSHGLGYDLGIGGGEMGTGLRPPSPCLSLPTRIGIASVTSSPTTTSPTSPLGGEFGVRAVRSKASITGGSGSTTPKSHSPVLVIGTEAVSLSSILPLIPAQQTHPAKLQVDTSPSTTTTSTTTEKYVSAPASVASPTSAASEVSAVSALSASSGVSGMGTADLDSFALGSPISPISPVSPVSPLSLDDRTEVKRAGSVRAEMMPF
ncbi:hypothetical protein B0T20DRAFT_392845 [Sordaria brevicollis]|uniref:Uncharacterized protein n=1 Tax=Sordaria brevicollis TaxID=83679 RepID=A0AAE0PED3_SORBR|nr:hypothetical protein B0T20DRAFT_392845 [Sordaria brevicollis]